MQMPDDAKVSAPHLLQSGACDFDSHSEESSMSSSSASGCGGGWWFCCSMTACLSRWYCRRSSGRLMLSPVRFGAEVAFTGADPTELPDVKKKPLTSENFENAAVVEDPSASFGAEVAVDENTASEIVGAEDYVDDVALLPSD